MTILDALEIVKKEFPECDVHCVYIRTSTIYPGQIVWQVYADKGNWHYKMSIESPTLQAAIENLKYKFNTPDICQDVEIKEEVIA